MPNPNPNAPLENELDVQLALAETVQSLKRRVTHLETLERSIPVPDVLVLDIDNTSVVVSNSVAESTIYTQSIAAGVLGTDNGIHLLLLGTLRNGSGAARNLTTRVKYGATTILTSTISIPTGGTRSFVWNGWIFAVGATNAQYGEMLGIHTITPNIISLDRGTAAEDSDTALTLEMTIEFAFAHANLIWDNRIAMLKNYIAP